MKPFDLTLAKQGHPLITRDGRDARIVSYKYYINPYPILAIITIKENQETWESYTIGGRNNTAEERDSDLFLKDTPFKESSLPKGMLPFDLKKAKSGHPIITRDGHKVKLVPNPHNDPTYIVAAQVEHMPCVRFFTAKGKYSGLWNDNLDLFLEEIEPNKTLPFDLEKAEAGHPIVTRDGRNVELVSYSYNNNIYILSAQVERHGSVSLFTKEGRYNVAEESNFDLFLKPLPTKRIVPFEIKYKDHPGLQTRNGNSVRVICVDKKSKTRPIVALVLDASNTELAHFYTSSGKVLENGDSNNDLQVVLND